MMPVIFIKNKKQLRRRDTGASVVTLSVSATKRLDVKLGERTIECFHET